MNNVYNVYMYIHVPASSTCTSTYCMWSICYMYMYMYMNKIVMRADKSAIPWTVVLALISREYT